MRYEFSEWENGCELVLFPENVEEMAQLARVAKNTKAEKPSISLRFGKAAPSLNLFMRKIKPSVQSNEITNDR